MSPPQRLLLLGLALSGPLLLGADLDEPESAPAPAAGSAEADELAPDELGFRELAEPFLARHCVRCHGGEEPEAGVSLEDAPRDMGDAATSELWTRIYLQVALEEMPPRARRRQPEADERAAFVDWVDVELERYGRGFRLAEKLLLPEYANYVDHAALFSGAIDEPAYTPARLWRQRPSIYAAHWERPYGRAHRLSVKIGGSGGTNERNTVPHGPHAGKGITTRYFADPRYANPFHEFVHHASGFTDYASIAADQAALEALLVNAESMAEILTRGVPVSITTEVKSRDSRHGNNHGMFVGGVERRSVARRGLIPSAFRAVIEHEGELHFDLVEPALHVAYDLLLRREPSPSELQQVWDEVVLVNAPLGHESALQAVLLYLCLLPEFVYRMEVGLGPEDEHGRRMLSPRELVYALHYAFRDTPPFGVGEHESEEAYRTDAEPVVADNLRGRHRWSPDRDTWLVEEMRAGRLETREDVERAVRRLLAEREHNRNPNHNSPIQSMRNPRILRFFREYFGYHRAAAVFKDVEEFAAREGFEQFHNHTAVRLMYDTDALVMHVLERDEDVLYELLTTDQVFVSYWDGQNQPDRVQRAGGEERYARTHDAQSYNLDPFEAEERAERHAPIQVPPEQRCGVLTQPSWLVAHSGNFDNDPVRRGKWIREKLLGGWVMDVPITVDARIPEDEHATLRERFAVVREESCWRCHTRMNPLGMPFEAYNHVGRFREQEQGRPVDTSGAIEHVSEEGLAGPVANAREMMERIARSELARQSFVRHVFRYWMGRNELLSDSSTLIAMERAYIESGGSFQELLVSLLTSDSFLYRR